MHTTVDVAMIPSAGLPLVRSMATGTPLNTNVTSSLPMMPHTNTGFRARYDTPDTS